MCTTTLVLAIVATTVIMATTATMVILEEDLPSS
jgi:hypothetical protein